MRAVSSWSRIGSVVMALLVVLPAAAQTVVSGPTIVRNPNFNAPQAARLDLETDLPVQVRVTMSYLTESRTILFPLVATEHSLPLLGFKPNRTYAIDIELIPGGPLPTELLFIPPLPPDFPIVNVVTSDPAAMEPGYTLVDCLQRGNNDNRPTWTIIVDAAGDVVWFTTECWAAVRQLPNGDLLSRVNETLSRMDMLGTREFLTLQDPAGGLHHELELTPHGTMLSLSRASVDVEDYPTSETNPGAPTATTTVRDEPIVEFFADGTVRRTWSPLGLLDGTRIGYDSLNGTGFGADWIHSNGIVYDIADDSIVVSGRHQDATFKFSRATGELKWILATHENWSPELQPFLLAPINAPFEWPYHQHAPMWTGDGSLLLFDNGNWRASPFDGTTPLADEDTYSRGVAYAIDETAMTVEQVWDRPASASPRLYSGSISDADWMPTTNNRLLHFGATSYVNGATSASTGRGARHTRIIELTDETPPVTVWDAEFYDAGGGRLVAYRSERIPDLYPPGLVLAPNGVGPSLRVDGAPGPTALRWLAAPTDASHTAADYYLVYASSSPDSGFTIVESVATLDTVADVEASPLVFYRVVAANSAGTSGDTPAP